MESGQLLIFISQVEKRERNDVVNVPLSTIPPVHSVMKLRLNVFL